MGVPHPGSLKGPLAWSGIHDYAGLGSMTARHGTAWPGFPPVLLGAAPGDSSSSSQPRFLLWAELGLCWAPSSHRVSEPLGFIHEQEVVHRRWEQPGTESRRRATVLSTGLLSK